MVVRVQLTPVGFRQAQAFGRLLALRAIIGLSGPDPETRTAWIHVGYVGAWTGHPSGPFELTASDLASCVAAFRAQVNPIGSDYEHASLIPDGAPKPASLWIQDMRSDGKNLFAKVEFTPRAAAMVRGGEYRFCSGVFAFDFPDRVDGKKSWRCVLRSIALTNDPFLDGQQPIALTRNGGPMAGTMIPKAALIEQLNALEGDELSEDQIEALAGSIILAEQAKNPAADDASGEIDVDMSAMDQPPPPAAAASTDAPPVPPAQAAAAAEPPKDSPPASPADQATSDAASMLASKLAEWTGMDPAALLAAVETNKEAIVSAIKGSGGKAAELSAAVMQKETAALKAQVAEQATQIKALSAREAERSKAARDSEVDLLVAEGRILPAAKEEYRALAHGAPDHFKALTAKLPKGAAFPAGRDVSLSRKDPNALTELETVVDTSRPEVVALDARLARMGADEATRNRLITKQFGR